MVKYSWYSKKYPRHFTYNISFNSCNNYIIIPQKAYTLANINRGGKYQSQNPTGNVYESRDLVPAHY